MNIRRVIVIFMGTGTGTIWQLALAVAVCFTSLAQSAYSSTSPIAITISVSPSNAVVSGTPLTIICNSATPTVGNSMILAQAGTVLAQTSLQSTLVLTSLSGRLSASTSDVYTFVFAYNYTIVSDTGLYSCYLSNSNATSVALSISVLAASTNTWVSDFSSSNTTQNQSEGQVNPANTIGRDSPALYVIVLAMAAMSTLITLVGIVLLMLRLRFGGNFLSSCKCKCRNSTDNEEATHGQNVMDKPPTYDEVIVQSPQSPPSYDAVVVPPS